MVKNFLVLLGLVVFLGACGQDPEIVIQECEIEEQFKAAAELFYSYSYKQDCVPIHFEDNLMNGAEEVKGLCNSDKTIKINTRLYEEASEEHKEMLILHELGHCVLDFGHNNLTIYFRDENDRLVVTGTSLMHEILFIDDIYYSKNKELFLQEFTKPFLQ